MAMPRAGRTAIDNSSIPFQLLLYLSGVLFVFYFLCTLSMIVYKSHVLSYPEESLACDLGLLLLMAALEALRVTGNLKEVEGYVVVNLVLTGATMLLAVYFLAWQSYVLRADLIINAVLLTSYSLAGVLAFVTVARFTSGVARSDSKLSAKALYGDPPGQHRPASNTLPPCTH
ncbi:hypothetical protein CRUP_003708 [Coryphaenoides rupestris]|nr:hypothetical protein CRUP_003708 [Coryphaenoides rupestris]